MLKIKTEGQKRNLYWRATTLDDYTGTGWQESLDLNTESDSNQIDSGSLALLPAAARNQANWVKQDVTVEALKDNHLIASAQPMRWTRRRTRPSRTRAATSLSSPARCSATKTYTVWSYAPRPTQKQLAPAGTNYPDSIQRDLEVIQTAAVPKFGTPDRDLLMTVFFDARFDNDPLMQQNRALYDVAKEVAGDVDQSLRGGRGARGAGSASRRSAGSCTTSTAGACGESARCSSSS